MAFLYSEGLSLCKTRKDGCNQPKNKFIFTKLISLVWYRKLVYHAVKREHQIKEFNFSYSRSPSQKEKVKQTRHLTYSVNDYSTITISECSTKRTICIESGEWSIKSQNKMVTSISKYLYFKNTQNSQFCLRQNCKHGY